MAELPETPAHEPAGRRQRKRVTIQYTPLRWWDHLVGLTLGGAFLVILMMTMDIGFTRDEGYYFFAGRQYAAWLWDLNSNAKVDKLDESLSHEAIDKYWWVNPEHPSLMKTLFGVSWFELSVKRDWMPESVANRLPTAFFAAILLYLLYLFAAEAFSRGPAILACFFLATMPRVFWHCHLSCFDIPMTMAWVLVFWSYWKGMDSRWLAWATGVFWGIALLTKLNSFFMPGILFFHYVIHRVWDLRIQPRRLTIKLPPFPKAFISMAILGPIIFYLFWPRIWYGTFNQLEWYFGRHYNHEYYTVHYLGELFYRPPFPIEYPFLVSSVTIPVVTLAAFAIGLGYMVKRFQLVGRVRAILSVLKGSNPRHARGGEPAPWVTDPRATVSLLALAGLVPFLIIAMPSVPIFGGTKHWMTAMPFVAMIAGLGAWEALRALWKWLGRWGIPAIALQPAVSSIVLTLILFPNLMAVTHSHPYSVAYYNELIGGYQGAADVGMMRQFWGYTSRAGLDYVNENARKNASIFFHDTNHDAYDMYKRDGLLRDDIRYTGDIRSAQYVLYHNEKEFNPVLYDVWRTYETRSPVVVYDIDGVPLLTIYENPRYRR